LHQFANLFYANFSEHITSLSPNHKGIKTTNQQEISQLHHSYINIIVTMPGGRDNVALNSSTIDLDILMNLLQNIEKFIDIFDSLCGERLLLDKNLNTEKIIYKDYEAKLSDLMEVIPPEQFLESAAKVEQFDLLYTKSIVAVKRLIIHSRSTR
jgi:hypothetical protein